MGLVRLVARGAIVTSVVAATASADVAVAVTAIGPGTETPAPLTSSAFAIGTRFSAPGMTCSLDQEAPTAEVVAVEAGSFVLSCTGERGQVATAVVIAPVRVAGPSAPIVSGTTSQVHVTLASVAPIGDQIHVQQVGDVELGAVARTAHGLDVTVTVPLGAKTAGLLVLAHNVELGRVDLAVVEPATTSIETRPAWFALEVGGYVGGFFPPSSGRGASALGNPSDTNDNLTSGPLAGGRIGVFPTRHVGLEVEGALAIAGFAHDVGTSTVALTRAQFAVRLVDEQRLGLRVLAGADLLGVMTQTGSSRRDLVGGVHYGIAFTIETRRNVWLRLGADHLVTAARDGGYAHCVEMQLGLLTRLGRRDRWW